MTQNQEIIEYLTPWQSKRFRPHEITFAEAAASLSTDTPLVSAKPGNNQSRWIMMNNETDKVAVLVFIGIWKWGSDLHTGNFVPKGEQAPKGSRIDRIQNFPSFKCEATYTFDTSVDVSIWDQMEVFEDHIKSQENFNRGGRPRRQWQNGQGHLGKETYSINSKLFARCTPFNSKSGGEPNVPYYIHPWITRVAKDPELKLSPNPEQTQYYDFKDGVLKKLEDTTEPRFKWNDIIWVSCKLGFVIFGDSWWPEIIPLELVRVNRLPQPEPSESESTWYPPVSDDFTPLELGEPIPLFNEPQKTLKRKERESEEPGTASNKRPVYHEPEADAEDQKGDIVPLDASESSSRPNLRSKQSNKAQSTKNRDHN